MSFDKKKTGAKIAALWKDRKLTQEQLAEKVEITIQYHSPTYWVVHPMIWYSVQLL